MSIFFSALFSVERLDISSCCYRNVEVHVQFACENYKNSTANDDFDSDKNGKNLEKQTKRKVPVSSGAVFGVVCRNAEFSNHC